MKRESYKSANASNRARIRAKRDERRAGAARAVSKHPPCLIAMGCVCAAHARGLSADKPCDTREPIPENRKAAAEARIIAAMEHLGEARSELDSACRDLCAIIGTSRLWRSIADLSDQTREVYRRMSAMRSDGTEFDIDHEPTDDEIKHPHHKGCGRGKS